MTSSFPRSTSLALGFTLALAAPDALAQTAPAAPAPPVAPVAPAAAREMPPMERVSLADAVQRALARNPTVAVALDEIRRARALVEQVRSASLPTLTGVVSLVRLDSDRLAGTGQVIAPANQFNATAYLTVPVVVPQRWVQWAHADQNVTVTRANAEDVRRQIAVTTARAYLTILTTQRQVAIAETARANAQAHFLFAQARFQGGVGNRIDVVRAAQEVAADESQLQASQTNLVRAREALGVLASSEGPLDAAGDPALDANLTPAVALQEATSQRADVRAQRERLSAAERVAHDNWADYMPYLVAAFQPFIQDPPTLTQPLLGWQAALVLTIPFYDGGLRYGLAHERNVLVAEGRESLEGQLRQARAEVRTAFDTMRHADESLAAAREASRLAVESLNLATIAYRAGASTNIEVIDAERRARDADLAASVAEDTARQARLDVLVSSGRFPAH